MLIYDLVDQQELIGYVRQIPFYDITLDTILPNRMVPDLSYRFMKGQLLDEDAASYRAFDTEAPIGKRQGFGRVTGELPPLSKKIRLGEEEHLRMRALESGVNDPIIAQIFDDAYKMVRAVQIRVEMARGQALSLGYVDINENGLQAHVDFGVPSGQMGVVPATVWSNPASTPVEDIRAWVETYTNAYATPPGYALTSTQVISALLRNTEIRTLAASIAGAPALVSPSTLDAVFAEFGLPAIRPYDARFPVNGVSTRVIPSNRFVMLPPSDIDLGATLYGPTAESIELTSAGQIVAADMPGVVAVVDKSWDPVSTWTKAAALAMPVVVNSQLIWSAVVI